VWLAAVWLACFARSQTRHLALASKNDAILYGITADAGAGAARPCHTARAEATATGV
jgi:hypothetical protein